MVESLRWSPEAIEDMESIAEYIARDSEFYARAVVSELVSVAAKIREYPLIGRIVPEIGDAKIRERFVYSYRLVYKMQDDFVIIAAIIHGRQLLEKVADRLPTSNLL